jgi:hypothetical protein
MKNQEDYRGNLDVSKQFYRDSVYNHAQGQVQFIGIFVRPFGGKRVLWRRAYGNMVRGCGMNLSGFVQGAMAASCEHRIELSRNF